MISVIVCSVNTNYLEIVKENIAFTIGLPYELISIDNRVEKNSLASVYNLAAANAKYPFLCFIHEDIIIHTLNWGVNLVSLLSNPKIGLVGVSGSKYKSAYAGTWPCCSGDLYRLNTIQHYKNTSPINHVSEHVLEYEKVAVIDGVFMATHKLIFKEYNFDSNLLKKFHGYDIDIAIAIGQHYDVIVTYNILVEHFSEGCLNVNWLSDSLSIHHKWMHLLPISIGEVSEYNKQESDYLSITCLLNIMIKNEGFLIDILKLYYKIIFKYFNFNKFKYSKQVFIYLIKYL